MTRPIGSRLYALYKLLLTSTIYGQYAHTVLEAKEEIERLRAGVQNQGCARTSGEAVIDEARKVMKWCQRGVRNAQEGNSLAAECYGTIGRLVLEVERLRLEQPEPQSNANK